ncbi:27217_t:CDS:2, partial [Racocetra persica]
HLVEISLDLEISYKLSESLNIQDNGQHLVEISSDLEISCELSESLDIQDNGTHKGQHLVEIPGLLPYINEQIVFAINDTFSNWPIAEHYVGLICITSFCDHHVEHQLSPNTMIFAPVNHHFSNECYKDIHHLVVN